MYQRRRSPSPRYPSIRPSIHYATVHPRSPLYTTVHSSSFDTPANFAHHTPRRYDDRATTAYSSFGTHQNPASANGNSYEQSRSGYRDGPRRHEERATSPPGWPTEAVKLFLAVMCEGTERQHDRFERENAARDLALDLEEQYDIRISVEELLRKYEILDNNYSEMIDARAGPREHGMIMGRHRERVRQRLLDEDRRRESHRHNDAYGHEDRERGRQRERGIEREERDRRERSSRPRRSDEPYYGRSPWSTDEGRRQR